MVYDCFIFNDELELLELRLKILSPSADKFVLVESARTLSGNAKKLHYQENKERFNEFNHKIIHVIAPTNELPAWEYEYFQRNCIKNGLENCTDDDIVFISDGDEIVNIPEILKQPLLQLPVIIELPMYYYYLNVKTNFTYWVNLVATAKTIREIDLGPRNETYPGLAVSKISSNDCNTGWHFSYCYGKDTKKYQEKIKAFSHEEYNTPYYLDEKRIEKCITLLVDLFERSYVNLKEDNSKIGSILPLIEAGSLKDKLYKPESGSNKLLPANLLFILQKKYVPKIKRRLKELFVKVNH